MSWLTNCPAVRMCMWCYPNNRYDRPTPMSSRYKMFVRLLQIGAVTAGFGQRSPVVSSDNGINTENDMILIKTKRVRPPTASVVRKIALLINLVSAHGLLQLFPAMVPWSCEALGDFFLPEYISR